jgi:hypothetical protein
MELSAVSYQSRPGGIGFMCISLKADRNYKSQNPMIKVSGFSFYVSFS